MRKPEVPAEALKNIFRHQWEDECDYVYGWADMPDDVSCCWEDWGLDECNRHLVDNQPPAGIFDYMVEVRKLMLELEELALQTV